MKELVHNINLDIKSLLNNSSFNICSTAFCSWGIQSVLKKVYTEKKVAGRYIFGLILLVFTVLITTLLSIGFSLSLGDNIKLLSLRGTIGMIATYIVAMSLVYPLYFKSGFKKQHLPILDYFNLRNNCQFESENTYFKEYNQLLKGS